MKYKQFIVFKTDDVFLFDLYSNDFICSLLY